MKKPIAYICKSFSAVQKEYDMSLYKLARHYQIVGRTSGESVEDQYTRIAKSDMLILFTKAPQKGIVHIGRGQLSYLSYWLEIGNPLERVFVCYTSDGVLSHILKHKTISIEESDWSRAADLYIANEAILGEYPELVKVFPPTTEYITNKIDRRWLYLI